MLGKRMKSATTVVVCAIMISVNCIGMTCAASADELSYGGGHFGGGGGGGSWIVSSY